MTEHQKMKAGDLLAAGSWVFSHIFIKYCYAIKINWKCFQVHSWAPHAKPLLRDKGVLHPSPQSWSPPHRAPPSSAPGSWHCKRSQWDQCEEKTKKPQMPYLYPHWEEAKAPEQWPASLEGITHKPPLANTVRASVPPRLFALVIHSLGSVT